MTDKNDGGPAFPYQRDVPHPAGGTYRDDAPGMSLRDWFAGQALAGLVKAEMPYTASAYAAYQYADAMLKERDR